MRGAIAAIAGLAALMAPLPVSAAAPRIGIVAPLTGTSETLGRQIVDGARAAAGDAPLEIADDGCTAAGGTQAARRFVEAKVAYVVGFLCAESIEAALPILRDARIPVITPAVRIDSLTDRRGRTKFLVYRLAPRDDSEAGAVAGLLPKVWKDRLFAIIDDGTIYGRNLAETLRAAAEAQALQPVFIDTYRPQMDNQVGLIGRLRRAGSTHVFVGGDRDDVAIMGRDAALAGNSMVFAGGEALRAAPGDIPLATGTLMVGLPEWSEIADPAAVAALATRGVVAEGYVLPSYAAMQVALTAAGGPAVADADPAALLDGEFTTALGAIRFDAKGDLSENPYRIFSFDGARFVPVETQ